MIFPKKAKKERFEQSKRKAAVLEEHSKTCAQMMEKIISVEQRMTNVEAYMKKRTKVSVWRAALKYTTDPIKKEKLYKKIQEVCDSFMDD